MSTSELGGGRHGRRGLLFIDLDGTLLDPDTYRASPEALALVGELVRRGVWTIPVTSKTSAELDQLAVIAEPAPLAVVEGGAVIVGEPGGCRVVGRRRHELVPVLGQLRGRGFPVRGLSEMSVAEVAKRTGLSLAAAERAMDRLASEPFAVVRPERLQRGWEDELAARARAAGAEVARGGRFWHLLGPGVHKGTGVAEVRDRLDPQRQLMTGAVGDAWNDLPMLAAVDAGYLLGGRVPDTDLPPGVVRIAEHGPAGFCVAGRDYLSRLDRAAGIRR